MIEDVAALKARFDDLVTRAYADSAALNQASLFEIDDVIDSADTRDRVAALLAGWEPLRLIHREEEAPPVRGHLVAGRAGGWPRRYSCRT